MNLPLLVDYFIIFELSNFEDVTKFGMSEKIGYRTLEKRYSE